MTKLSEKYRVIADLYAYLEAHPFDDLCNASHCTVIDDGDGIEIKESLYRELVASSNASKLLDAVAAHGIEVHRYDATGYVYDIDLADS
ncbi:hypothetical protein [Microseira sp. BLCC-F43]|jgi:hypothetical protein|uniref:hypothetical protein n=1 Tax=Microseira sp. BLCC-F43 TaxID=3153602 RepID=UPI0035B81310